MKVFLGGTCSGYKWRNELIPLLHCDYYNPIVKNWSEKDRLREVHERETADYVLYVITSGMKGAYSIAEIIDDSNKRPEKTIVCVLYKGFDKQMAHSLKAVVNLAKSNGVKICNSLTEVAEYINNTPLNEENKDQQRQPLVKVGDTVYSYCEQFGRILPYFVDQITIDYDTEQGEYWTFNASCVENGELLDYIDFSIDEIDKTVFLTEEEIEKSIN